MSMGRFRGVAGQPFAGGSPYGQTASAVPNASIVGRLSVRHRRPRQLSLRESYHRDRSRAVPLFITPSVASTAPALHRSVSKKSTRVAAAETDSSHTREPFHCDRRKAVSLFILPSVASTELPFIVFTPALHRSISKKSTRVTTAGSDGSHTREPLHCDRSPNRGVLTSTVTELPVKVVAPAFRRSISKKSTRVHSTSRDRYGSR